MSSLDEIRSARLAKLKLLEAEGINPYPAKTARDTTIAEAVHKFEELQDGRVVTLSGRIMSLRAQGKIIFLDLDDGTGRFQALLKSGEPLPEKEFELFEKAFDIGDFIEVKGTLFLTQKGQQTILAQGIKMLSKSLLPLPEKWHGLQDVEGRLRKRYLDILSNPEVKELFIKKAKFWDATRNFLKNEGFVEVETPTLEVTTGGAEARPFKTHHNDFDIDVFLRISVGELWQKRLLAAGFPRVFEIGRVYRNEGSSPEHTQEFTNLEFYAAYMDYLEGMDFTERMIKEVVQETFGTLQFEIKGEAVDLSKSWERISYVETIKKRLEIDVLEASEQEMMAKLDELSVKYEGNNRERLTDSLWKVCRKQIMGPTWLMDVPKLVSPLSKAKPEDPRLTERVQLLLNGAECTNGFSELNDPVDQAERFAMQKKLIEAGDEEAMMPDEEFVEMLEHGMPPAFGFAYGERLFAFLANKPLRETQLFPLMRPKEEKLKKELQGAVAIINKGASLEGWQELNTTAHLTAALGAREGKELFSRNTVQTKDGKNIFLNIQHGILIKTADSSDKIREILETAQSSHLKVAEFTREMLETTNDKKIDENTKAKNFDEIEFLGALVFGPKNQVDSLTKDLERYK